ncbi:MAG: DUF4175 family protein [Verrucomicrobiales bacterium]
MSARLQLPPVTAKKLTEFASRRRLLILIRGGCAALISLIALLSVLALLDWAFLIPDAVRWGLSFVAYAAVGAVLWFTCLRYLFGHHGEREIARIVERAEPTLREDLISAVELGDPRHLEEHQFESAAFRSLVQDDVARRMGLLNVRHLLPTSRVAPWMRYAGIAAVLLAVLLIIPGLHFPQLFSRAALPLVNIGRPSNIKVELLDPSPGNQIVPSGDTVPLLARITGGDPDVVLETVTDSEGRRRTELERKPNSEFGGAINVGQEDVRFRIRAGGTITEFYTLKSMPRPAIAKWGKTYRFPDYSTLSPQTLEEEHGELTALEGSVAALTLTANQPIEKAEVVVTKADGGEVRLPVAIDGSTLTAEIPVIAEHSSYKLELTAAESGFTDPFAPSFEIRAIPDLTPAVDLAEPTENRTVVPREKVNVAGTARDDVALAAVNHSWRINKGPWQEAPLAEKPGKEAQVSTLWDLAKLPLKNGDVVFVRLTAADTKGSVGESQVIRLSITELGAPEKKKEWAKKEQQLAKELKEVAKQAAEARDKVNQAGDTPHKPEEKRSFQEQQQLMDARDAVAEAARAAEDAFEKLRETIREAPSRRESEELAAAAQVLAELKNNELAVLEERLQQAAEGEELMRDAKPQEQAQRAAERANNLAERYEDLAAADRADLIEDDLAALAAEQKAITEDARANPQGEEAERVAVQQETAAMRADDLGKDLAELSESLEGGEKGKAEHMARELQEAQDKVEEKLAVENPKVAEAANEADWRVKDALQNAENLERDLQGRADWARQELMKQADQASPEEMLADLAKQAQAAERRAKLAANLPEEAKRQERTADQQEAFEQQWEAAADTLKDLADVESQRPDADESLVADASQAARALDALRAAQQDAPAQPKQGDQGGNDDPQQANNGENGAQPDQGNAEPSGIPTPESAQESAEAIAQIAEAFETLDADSDVRQAAEAVAELARQENFGTQQQLAQENPGEWEAAQQAIKDLPQTLSQAKSPPEAGQAAQQAAQNQAQNEVAQEMQRRDQQAEQNPEPGQSPAAPELNRQGENLAEIGEQLAQAQEKMAPAAQAAREALEQLAPDVSEMLRGLAQEAEQAADAAGDLAQQANDAAAESGEGEPGTEASAEVADAARHHAGGQPAMW